MAKEPGIFIKNEVIYDAHRSKGGSPDFFKSQIAGLIAAGQVVAVGESSIERTFDTPAKFETWFDTMSPKRMDVEDPPKVTNHLLADGDGKGNVRGETLGEKIGYPGSKPSPEPKPSPSPDPKNK